MYIGNCIQFIDLRLVNGAYILFGKVRFNRTTLKCMTQLCILRHCRNERQQCRIVGKDKFYYADDSTFKNSVD